MVGQLGLSQTMQAGGSKKGNKLTYGVVKQTVTTLITSLVGGEC